MSTITIEKPEKPKTKKIKYGVIDIADTDNACNNVSVVKPSVSRILYDNITRGYIDLKLNTSLPGLTCSAKKEKTLETLEYLVQDRIKEDDRENLSIILGQLTDDEQLRIYSTFRRKNKYDTEAEKDFKRGTRYRIFNKIFQNPKEQLFYDLQTAIKQRNTGKQCGVRIPRKEMLYALLFGDSQRDAALAGILNQEDAYVVQNGAYKIILGSKTSKEAAKKISGMYKELTKNIIEFDSGNKMANSSIRKLAESTHQLELLEQSYEPLIKELAQTGNFEGANTVRKIVYGEIQE